MIATVGRWDGVGTCLLCPTGCVITAGPSAIGPPPAAITLIRLGTQPTRPQPLWPWPLWPWLLLPLLLLPPLLALLGAELRFTLLLLTLL